MADNIGVVILHYGDIGNTKECINSILKVRNVNLRLIVVINPSVDTDKEDKFVDELKKKYPEMLVINNSKNRGFSEGNNLGIKKALYFSYPYVILLNNDTIVSSNLFEELISYAIKNPEIGIISPKIYFVKGYEYHKARYREDDKGKVIWYAGGIIDWDNILAKHRGIDEVDRGQYEETSETPFATGCCMLIRKEVVEKIGLLDEKYFLYFEDVDYSLRAKKAGFKIVYFPKAHLWHKNAASSGKPGSATHVYYQTRNRLYFGFKYASLSTKKSLFFDSLKMIMKNNLHKKACLDYYLGRMGKGDL